MSYGRVSALDFSVGTGMGQQGAFGGRATHNNKFLHASAGSGGHRFIQAMHFHGIAHGVTGLRILNYGLWRGTCYDLQGFMAGRHRSKYFLHPRQKPRSFNEDIITWSIKTKQNTPGKQKRSITQ